MYTKPAPVFSSSRKSKKEDKSRKTDEKPSSSTKKSKAEPKEVNKTTPKASPKKNEKPQNRRMTRDKSRPPTPHPSPAAKAASKSLPSTPVSVPVPAAPAAAIESPAKPVMERMSAIVVPVIRPTQPLVNNRIIETRPNSEIPSAIKFRVSYGKDTLNRSNSFKTTTTPNLNVSQISDGGCANCSKHSRLNDSMTYDVQHLPAANQEDLYKYLGIDTNPPHEKTSPEPSPNDANQLYNNRRSLRVFIQQRQNEFTRAANEKSQRDDKSPEKACVRSPIAKTQNLANGVSPNGYVQAQQTTINGQQWDGQSSNCATKSTISSHIKQRRSYEPSPLDGDSNRQMSTLPSGSTNNSMPKETECDASRATVIDSNRLGDAGTSKQPVARIVPKRKIVLPSPMMLTKMFERYKQCFKQGFAMRQGYARRKSTYKKRSSNNLQPNETTTTTQEDNSEKAIETNGEQNTATDPSPLINPCEELINTFSPTSITHSNASTDSAIVVNPNINDMTQPTVILSSSDSLQWQQDHANHIDKSQFQNPLDAKHGAVLAILTHSVSPNNDDIVVVIQQSLISYWYSTSKVLGMFGIARSWMKIGDIVRLDEGESGKQCLFFDFLPQFFSQ